MTTWKKKLQLISYIQRVSIRNRTPRNQQKTNILRERWERT